MSRKLIDRDALIASIPKTNVDIFENCRNCNTLMDWQVKELIDKQPTIDAVVVKHGEWSNRRTWAHDGEWYCTACDKEITIYMGEKRGNDRYNYCPNCGAKMDGDVTNE